MNRSQTMEDLHDQLQMNIEANKELNQRVSQEMINIPFSHGEETFKCLFEELKEFQNVFSRIR